MAEQEKNNNSRTKEEPPIWKQSRTIGTEVNIQK